MTEGSMRMEQVEHGLSICTQEEEDIFLEEAENCTYCSTCRMHGRFVVEFAQVCRATTHHEICSCSSLYRYRHLQYGLVNRVFTPESIRPCKVLCSAWGADRPRGAHWQFPMHERCRGYIYI